MGGAAGHAGLFGLPNRCGSLRACSAAIMEESRFWMGTCQAVTARQESAARSSWRWMGHSVGTVLIGSRFSERSFGHLATRDVAVIDPLCELEVVLLSNGYIRAEGTRRLSLPSVYSRPGISGFVSK